MDAESAESPLTLIRQREQALAGRLEAARAEADAARRHARGQAEAYLARMAREADREAQALFDDAATRVEEECDALIQQARARAELLRAAGGEQIEPIARLVASWILPAEGGGCNPERNKKTE